MDPSPSAIQEFLTHHRPFATLDRGAVTEMAEAAQVERYEPGELILDAFAEPNAQMFVVLAGEVEVWNHLDQMWELPDERLGPGGVFGFSSMLTERPVGPRVVAAGSATVASIPGAVVSGAFTSADGAKFLAEHVSAALGRATPAPPYSLVDDLVSAEPLLVGSTDPISEAVRQMSERGLAYAAVALGDGRYGIVSDAVLRQRVIVEGLSVAAPVRELVNRPAPGVRLGDSAAEALIRLLEAEAEFLLVLDEDRCLRGVVGARDFVVSPPSAGASLHEQLRRSVDVGELVVRARSVVGSLDDLLGLGLTADRVIGVYSTLLDTIVRRAITLVFEEHDELSVEAFTWLSLGSNGRREAVPSSDVDTAAAFSDALGEAEIAPYRMAFAEVHRVLHQAGLASDRHGATASRPPFSRTNAQWRAAGRAWMSAPGKDQGAVMASLLVDGRAIYGDAGLGQVSQVFSDLRRHHGTMRLLLQESLSRRAKTPSRLELLAGREAFDIKRKAILPIVNLARWAALSVGSSVLPTIDRLRVASGSAILPASRATNLIEAFGVLQRLRLRYQLIQVSRGEAPTDQLLLDRLSPIDRGVLHQAVREVAAAQRRMDNISLYVPVEAWTAPEGG